MLGPINTSYIQPVTRQFMRNMSTNTARLSPKRVTRAKAWAPKKTWSATQPSHAKHDIATTTKTRSFSTSRNIIPTHIQAMIANPTQHVAEQAKPLCHSIQRLQTGLLTPHLRYKIDLDNRDLNENFWVKPDQAILHQCQRDFLSDESYHPIRPFLMELTQGLLTHSDHRLDIIELNKGKVTPENGPLIREMYILTERASVKETSQLMRSFNQCDLFTEAYVRSDIRRLARNIVRVGASQDNARKAAQQSLTSSLITFPDRYQHILTGLGIGYLPHLYQQEKVDLKELNETYGSVIKNFFEAQLPLSEGVNSWVDDQFQGLSFEDLVVKYMHQGLGYETSLQKISTNSTKVNKGVNEKMSITPPTNVTLSYIYAMMQVNLFRPAFISPTVLRYRIVG